MNGKWIHSLEIRGLRVPTRIGVSEEERAFFQLLSIDLTARVRREPGAADLVETTVDYGVLAEAVATVARSQERLLLETLAEEILAICERYPAIESAEVSIRKLRPPLDLVIDEIGVRVSWQRS
ncbi:MAG: dihydroneopterin aldolase [Acidimicrobiales bacterium]